MSSSINNVLYASPEELKAIKSYYGKTNEEISEDIKYLREWLSKQKHLPQNIDNLFFEKLLRMNKFSLERCKKKIDMYFSIRNITPEVFDDRDMKSPQLQAHMECLMLCPLPKLTSDFSRIHIFKFISKDADLFDMMVHSKYIFAQGDLRFIYDECITDTYIVDLGNCTMGHVLKHNFVLLKKGATIIEKAYSDRIKGVHFVNLPNYANILVNFAQTILNEKMAQRVQVHKNMDSLHKFVPKNILPKEYGGTEKSITELNNNWRKVLEENNLELQEMAKTRSIEEFRNGKPIDTDIFGSIHGSFRQLAVD